jgi:hypothetical protein
LFDYFVSRYSKQHETERLVMGSLSIQKGKRAERAVATMLNPIIARVCQREGVDPMKLQRNLKQVQQGGFDLDGLDWLAPEIKHHKAVSLGSWWAQCVRQATQGRIPVLIWKAHGGKWQVRMIGQIPLSDGSSVRGVVDVSDFNSFLVWFELELTLRIRAAIAKGDPTEIAGAVGAGEGAGEPSAPLEAPALNVERPLALVAANSVHRPWEKKSA